MPSSWGIFVYSDDTSMDASLQFVGGLSCSIWFMNSVVFFIYEGKLVTYGCSHLSTNWDIFSVILSQLETIGQMPIGFLCIFLRKYNFDVLWFCGGLQNWYQFINRNPFLYKISSFAAMASLSLCVMFLVVFISVSVWVSKVCHDFGYVVTPVLDYCG